jgi:hypothetical protein
VTNIPEKYFPFWQDVDYTGSLSEPATLQGLKFFGVDYVVVHDRTDTQWPHWREPRLTQIKGLDLLEDLGRDRLFKISAPPAKALVFYQTLPFYNYDERQLIQTNDGFTPSLVPEKGDPTGIGWRILMLRGEIDLLNVSGEPQNFRLEFYALGTSATRRVKITADGRDAGEYQLNNHRPTHISIPGIRLEPDARAKVVIESLDGADLMDLTMRKINASSCFGYFDVFTD